MSWQDDAILMLRVLIGDNDSPVTYGDARLEEILIVAAKYVNKDAKFANTYTVDVNTISISPDPSTDDDFINFLVLKSACIVDNGNARLAAAKSGIEAKCGPAQIKTLNHFQAFNDLLNNGYCKTYEKSLFEYKVGNSSYIRAVLSPFVNSNFDPAIYNSYTNSKDRLR